MHRCAHGPLHIWPSYRVPRSCTTPVVAAVNHKGGTGKTTFLCGTKMFGFTRMSRGSRVQLINSVPRAMTGAGCRTSKLSPPCAACALSGDGNPGTICAQMCKWPFAHIAIIWSTPELDHAACCDREPERRHWQDLLLVRHQEVRIRPHVPRESRPADQQCSSSDDGCRAPDVETFPTLRGVCFIRRRQPGYHLCTDVQRAICTKDQHI